MALWRPGQPAEPARGAIEREGVDLDGGDPDDTDGDARPGEPGRQWISTTRHPTDATLSGYVDKYFLRTKARIPRYADKRGHYGVLTRRPDSWAPRQTGRRVGRRVVWRAGWTLGGAGRIKN